MGRRAKVTREALLASAIEIVDAQGLEALSMRRLAEALGVEAMSLYRHVASKEALLDAVHEAVLSKLRTPRRTGDWRRDARALARALHRALLAHPNALPLFATRPAVTRGSLRQVEQALGLLAEPFPRLEPRIQALQVLVAYVVGSALAQAAPPVGADYAGLPAEEFPILSQAGPVLARYSAARELDFGLEALLDGLAKRARRS